MESICREDCSIRSTGRCESQFLLGSRDSGRGVGTVLPSPRYGHSLPRAARRKPPGDHVELGREVGMDCRDEAGRDAQTTLYHPSSAPLQLEERAARSAEFGSSLQSSRCEIADLNVRIQKLRSQILSIKSHVRKHMGPMGT